MKIERMVFCTINAVSGDYYHTWIDLSNDENICLTLKNEQTKKIDKYHVSSIFHHALTSTDEDSFIIPDGYPDGLQDVEIYSSEIKRLAKDILLRFPVVIGFLNLKVEFEQNNHDVPF